MSLHWLETEKRTFEAPIGNVEYLQQVAIATRCQRFLSVLLQIAPTERSKFFTSPELELAYEGVFYCIEGIDRSTFDLAIQHPSSQLPPTQLARIFLPKGFQDHKLPTEDQVAIDLDLIERFGKGQVSQPDLEKDPDGEMILYPRVKSFPPIIRFFKRGRDFDNQTHIFTLSGVKHTVLVPRAPDPTNLPIATHDQMLETVSQIEHLYQKNTDTPLDISSIEDRHTKLKFVDTKGNWHDVPSDNTILHVGGGASDRSLGSLLASSLTDPEVRRVYYELYDKSIIRFQVTR